MFAVESFDTDGNYVPRSQQVFVDERYADAEQRRRQQAGHDDVRIRPVSQATANPQRQWM